MSNSVAIVTGASSGIGKATALRLARDFRAIVLAARSGEKLAEVGRQVKAIGAEPLVLELDLMAPTAAEVVVRKTLDRFGRIDALVNIAGAVVGLDVFEMTDEQWNTVMELKFHGARRLTIRAWDALKESKGAVIFISGNALILKLMLKQYNSPADDTVRRYCDKFSVVLFPKQTAARAAADSLPNSQHNRTRLRLAWHTTAGLFSALAAGTEPPTPLSLSLSAPPVLLPPIPADVLERGPVIGTQFICVQVLMCPPGSRLFVSVLGYSS
jgi:short chain dehydrogenase